VARTKSQKVKLAFLVFFGIALLAMIWPIYPLFSRIRPLVLGMPFSLFYLVLVLSVCFCALVGLYLWEDRKGELE
jgi:hypothetical protein